MKKEYREDEVLNQIGPIIAAPHMSQFMTKNKLGFPRLQAFLRRQENHRMKKPQEEGRPMGRGYFQFDVTIHRQARGEPLEKFIQPRARWARTTFELLNPTELQKQNENSDTRHRQPECQQHQARHPRDL